MSRACGVSYWPWLEYGACLYTAAVTTSLKKSWPVWTTRSWPMCAFRWMCGVRPGYQPGKTVRKVATPAAFEG